MERGAWWATVHGAAKSWTQLKGQSFPGGASGKEPTYQCMRLKRHKFDPWVGKIPWKGMVTHSSILAWRIPWKEEPVGLQSMGLHRVGQD